MATPGSDGASSHLARLSRTHAGRGRIEQLEERGPADDIEITGVGVVRSNVGNPDQGKIVPAAVNASQRLLLNSAQCRQASPLLAESRMVDGKDDEDAKEEAGHHPAAGRPSPQCPSRGRGRGQERDKACVRDQIPVGVDPPVVGASRVKPGFV